MNKLHYSIEPQCIVSSCFTKLQLNMICFKPVLNLASFCEAAGAVSKLVRVSDLSTIIRFNQVQLVKNYL